MSTSLVPSPLPLSQHTVAEFLTALAAKTPTPGGGSVAALVGAIACAQVRMTLSYTLGKKKFADFEPELQTVSRQVDALTAECVDLMEQDRLAYEALGPFLKLSREEQTADTKFHNAVQTAVRVPMACAHAALHIVEHSAAMAEKINPMLISDLGVAVELACSVVAACALNIHINLPLVPDKKAAADYAQEIYSVTRQATELADRIRRQVRTIMPRVS